MRYAKALCLLLFGVGLLAFAGAAGAKGYEGVNPAHAHRHVVKAQRELVRAKANLREARDVERATRLYSSYDYSSFAGRVVEPEPVGRWVWLARDVGWPWSQVGTLMCVVARESSGNAGQPNNTGSGALGLLQEMPDFYIWYGVPYYDRANPRQNLRVGLIAWRRDGWSPWGM